MKKFFIISIYVFVMCSAHSQNNSFKKFLDSFQETSKQKSLNFKSLLSAGKKMSKEDALKYVYNNDSSMLYCKQKIFSMETEKVEGISRELYLPQKCLRITTSDFILIGYSSFECQDPDKLLKIFLTLKIINTKNLNVTDSLQVYSGNEYDWEMTGLLNPHNCKFFVLKEMGKRTSNAKGWIYRINTNLKFEVEKQQDDIKNMTDNLENDIELLNWVNEFYDLR